LKPNHQKYNRAIVIGGSMAGLPTAQMLTRYFKRVTIVDRDEFTGEPIPRKGVPQARHPHLLLKRGQLILEEIFPGLSQALIQAGAIEFNWGADLAHHVVNWRPYHHSIINNLACSRELLEHTIRARLKLNPQVEWLSGGEVVGLDLAGGQLTGVQLQKRGENRAITHLTGDFVADCSGRSSHTGQWLEAVGYPAPRQEVINALVGYASRIYRRVPGVDWKAMIVTSEPPLNSRGIYITPLEGGRWLVALQGYNAPYPPTAEAEYAAYLRSVPVAEIQAVMARAVPLGPVNGYRNTMNCMLHFEELPRYLENFVALGDAVCTTNPAYGMGMSTALIAVQELDQCLAAAPDPAGLSGIFQKQVYRAVQPAWQRATSLDSRWSNCEGAVVNNDPDGLLVQNYMNQVFKATYTILIVLEAFNQMVHLLVDESILFRPDIVLQVVAEMTGQPRPAEVAAVAV
jgi:2-polyprenyl-6-methoxyphenol hydroxylase-like FAD-dependent oxidoreductase